MNRDRTLLAAALLAVATSCAGHTTSRPAAAEDLDAADQARAAAMVAADVAALDRMLDDSLTYTHSNGRVDSKRSLMDEIASGRVDYRTIEATRSVGRLFGGVGIVTGPVRMDVAARGRVLRLRSVYTAVYRRHDGHWRLVAYHSSPVE